MNPAAKFHFVGLNSLSWYPDLLNDFTPDRDGGSRVFTSIAAAIADANVVASRGDVVLVLPGHAETISSSTALTISKAGLTIIGLGEGALRPTFTLDTATSATINVTAANVTIRNMIFVANLAAIVAAFTTTTATDFALIGCEFRDTTAILNFVNIVDTNATSNNTDGLRIEDCKRIGLGATTSTTIVKMDGTNNRLSIKRNYFAHAAVTGGGLMIIATGKVVTNAEITDNVCNFVGASNLTTGVLITTDGSTNSGYLARNYAQGLDDTTPILVTASSGFKYYDNKYSSNADASGFLLPAVDS